jgi:Leucine-rich repeat (LRR) protein
MMKKLLYLLATATIVVGAVLYVVMNSARSLDVNAISDTATTEAENRVGETGLPGNVLTEIPDPAFLAYCLDAMENPTIDVYGREQPAWDTNGDGRLSIAEAAAVTSIDVRGSYELGEHTNWEVVITGEIASLEGIEYFTGLTYLNCLYNQLTSLDLSKNTALTTLYCSWNQLASLDLSKNTALTQLNCDSNGLTSLDVSKNTALTYLDCYGNGLTSLDLSKNTALIYLDCCDNGLTSLDVSNNTALTYLYCGNNPGDGVATFPITAWFDNTSLPVSFPVWSWTYNGKTITVDCRKAP